MGSYANVAVRDVSGNIIGYQSTTTGQTSAGTGDINYDNPITAATYAQSAKLQALQAQYAQTRNQVVSSAGTVMYQGQTVSTVNPYASDTAAGIAWEVAKTGGGTDLRMNAIAEAEVRAAGGDPSFITYATDIYVERPQYSAQTLVTRAGQTFVNPAWSGVPIRLNLTLSELSGATERINTSPGKYYQYS
jgi:hypothetical protein